MSYKVTKDGEIICDTAEEAIALAKALVGSEGSTRLAGSTIGQESGSRWTDSRYRELLVNLKGGQKSFLEELLENPHGKTDKALRTLLGYTTNNELAGVTSGLSKNAKKVGMGTSDIYTKEVITVGDEQVFEYRLTQSFRAIAERAKNTKGR